jgi:hypothetical protein
MMNPILWAKMVPILWTLLKTLGTVLGSLAMQLLTGKALKQLILIPIEKWTKKSKSVEDDKVVDKIKQDWDIKE